MNEVRERFGILKEIYDGRKTAERWCKLFGDKELADLNKQQKKIVGRTLAKLMAIIGVDEVSMRLWQAEQNPEHADEILCE